MKIVPHNLMKHELVGLSAHIVDSKDPNHVCTKGTILSESKEMFQIETERGTVAVPKKISVFEITLPDETVVRVNGSLLRGRPEDRMKKRSKRSW